MTYPAKKHVIRTFDTLLGALPLSEQIKPQVILLQGESVGYRHDTDRELPFRQESNFFYLTGCNVPSSLLIASCVPEHDAEGVLRSSATSVRTTLFIPEAKQSDLMWSVPPPTKEEASRAHDATSIEYYPSSLDMVLEKVVKGLAKSNGVVVHALPFHVLSPKKPQRHNSELQLRTEGVEVTLTEDYLLDALHRTRLLKDADEIELIKQANLISSRAHEIVMRVLGRTVKKKLQSGGDNGTPLLPDEWLIEKEAQAEAIFVASCRRDGSIHQAYLPIVASSTRASTLHYCCNDKEFAWGPVEPNDHFNGNSLAVGQSGSKEVHPQVLLIDAGCEWNNYASDITRTMPVGNGGKFTTEARAIYELVLEMQKQAFSIIKPGIHWDNVQLSCHRTLIKGFQRLNIFKSPESSQSGSWNSAEAILASGVSSAFFPHGVGHSLGLDVHDVPEASKPKPNNTILDDGERGDESFYTYLRLRLPLKAGMVVTVEPGIYFSPHLLAAIRNSRHVDHEVLQRYEKVGGVRIEDVIVITDKGYDNLTQIRSDVEWIEEVCSGVRL